MNRKRYTSDPRYSAVLDNMDEAKLADKRPIITEQYWLQMIAEVQQKIDSFTTVKALKQSKKYR